MGASLVAQCEEVTCQCRRYEFIPGVGRPPGEEDGPTPVFLPGKAQGQRSLVVFSPRGHKSQT